ncbi:hypothetical protein HUT18_23075 [Streptomyces sp. NA04227]|uniref:hypothetical protein n=1 Tax=Streptomyces sp. NA04227 TaxID=2742136 RepID=UPI001590B541|nr:hypothetical protein [Streptomyces sp. NA04227]QKW08830.1 hypothetical protein HUT18_23075 [Streptomyces sp. NA04227]
MSAADRRAETVRRLLEGVAVALPPDAHAHAVHRGERLLRRRTLARRILWLVLLAAALAFTVWACTVHPWVEPPSDTTPPLTGW